MHTKLIKSNEAMHLTENNGVFRGEKEEINHIIIL